MDALCRRFYNSVSRSMVCFVPDSISFLLACIGLIFLKQEVNRGGNVFEFAVIPGLKFTKFICQIFVGQGILAHKDEGSDDSDIDLNCFWTVENAGQHSYALLGESEGFIPSPAPAFT